MQIIATNIKGLIQTGGFKQKSIAERAGFGEKEFSDMLNGRRCIKAEHIPQIATALGVTPNELFELPTTANTLPLS